MTRKDVFKEPKNRTFEIPRLYLRHQGALIARAMDLEMPIYTIQQRLEEAEQIAFAKPAVARRKQPIHKDARTGARRADNKNRRVAADVRLAHSERLRLRRRFEVELGSDETDARPL